MLRVRLPEECAIVGYIDISSGIGIGIAAAAAVPFTSGCEPRRGEPGRRAAQLLLDEAVEGHVHEQPVFDPALVVRESSMGHRSTAREERSA